MKVLITAPSLNESENVSGISTLIGSIISHGKQSFVHFIAGRKDGEKASVVWILKQLTVPFRFFFVVKREKPELVHINTAFIPLAIIRDAALAAAAGLADRPVLLHIHGGPFVIDKIPNPFLASIAGKLLRTSKQVIVFSAREKTRLLEHFPGVTVSILPNAISLEGVPETERGSGEKTLIFFGRLHPSKGLEYIIEACRTLVEQGFKFKYTCFGTGPEKDRFLTEMHSILGERFTYGGVVSGADKWDALSHADIFFQPSRDEGLPIALLEAMAAGCVPVMSDSGAVSTVIEDGHNGYLVEPEDLTQIVGKLKMLISAGAELGELRENARNTIREKFNMNDYVVKLEQIYEEMAAGK